MKLAAVNLQIGAFVGTLRYKGTGETKMCDVCGKEPAMWQHPLKRGAGKVYLCFGCESH